MAAAAAAMAVWQRDGARWRRGGRRWCISGWSRGGSGLDRAGGVMEVAAEVGRNLAGIIREAPESLGGEEGG
ncbi:hypothetical protein Tco_1292326 [Tanacetum coccineum]